MQQVYQLLIGIGVLILGFFIGNFLAKKTREELRAGKKWFLIITILGLMGGVIGLILGNDFLLFSFSFIAIVTCSSLAKR